MGNGCGKFFSRFFFHLGSLAKCIVSVLQLHQNPNQDSNADTDSEEQAFHIHRSASRRGNDAEKKKVYCGLYKNTHLGWFPFQNVHTKNLLDVCHAKPWQWVGEGSGWSWRWRKVGGQSEWVDVGVRGGGGLTTSFGAHFICLLPGCRQADALN